ncbi:hypothetical protein ABFS83_04G146500 [Erythranthe nasuta]
MEIKYKRGETESTICLWRVDRNNRKKIMAITYGRESRRSILLEKKRWPKLKGRSLPEALMEARLSAYVGGRSGDLDARRRLKRRALRIALPGRQSVEYKPN